MSGDSKPRKIGILYGLLPLVVVTLVVSSLVVTMERGLYQISYLGYGMMMSIAIIAWAFLIRMLPSAVSIQ